MKTIQIFALLIFVYSLTGCDLKDRKQDALAMGDLFFQKIAKNDYQGALDLCNDDFFANADREKWLQALQAINNEYGSYQSHHFMKWNVRNAPTGNVRDAAIGMAYRVIYDNGERLETFTMAGADQLVITSYDSIPNKRQPRKSH